MSLCFEISLNSAPPVVAGGDSLAVVTAMAVMRWDGGVPEVELQVAGTPGAATTMNTSVASSETRHERPD
jgi:hypothetical protein